MNTTKGQHRLRPSILDEKRSWVYRDFLKEKLRVRERYWRFLEDAPPQLRLSARSAHPDEVWIIPDGLAWRTHLPLLTQLVERSSAVRLLLLESAVDCMDYRNTSPCVTGFDHEQDMIPEVAAPQERSRLKKLLEEHPSRVMSFCDLSMRQEEHDEWDSMEYESMSTLDRSNHAVLRAGAMVRQYFEDIPDISDLPTVVILSSNSDFVCQFPSLDEGINLLLVDQVLELLAENKTLADDEITMLRELQNRCEEEYLARNVSVQTRTNTSTQEYLSQEEIVHGLNNNTLLKGRLNVTKENPKEAFVMCGGEPYFVNQQCGHFNRALHQDIVILQPLDESEWGRPVGRRRLVHHRDGDVAASIAANNEIDLSPAVPSAQVVSIEETTRRQFVATLVDVPMSDESACLVIPMDIRIPKIRIKTNGWRRYVGQRLLVQIDAWEVGSNSPGGHCLEILGKVADLETEIKCLLYENQMHLEPFSAAALAYLPPEGREWTVPPEEIEKRLDLRTTRRIFSVDPAGCQDIDDTMHARVLPNGDVEIGVHIADVTYFVPHKTPLDIEAQMRGTTFYLVDRRFDMLPTVLSSDLCSLHGDVDRLAVSTIWTFSSDLRDVKTFWFGRSVIRNYQAMTYEQAHNIVHDQPPDDPSSLQPPPLTAGYHVQSSHVVPLKEDLSILIRLARKLRKDREEIGGAVDLSSGDQGSELKFSLDDHNHPTKVTPKKQLEIHHTIAELMILANTWVAKTIYDKMPENALLRVHRTAEESRFEDLKEVLKAGKISFDGSSNMALAESLKKAETTTQSSSLMALFQALATRAMSEAQYVSTGEVEGEQGLSHYGLGVQKYTHFTSPIRRYADVVVHKQLLADDLNTNSKGGLQKNQGNNGFESLPSSKVISILGGEGLIDDSLSAKDEVHTLEIAQVTSATMAGTQHQAEADLWSQSYVTGEVSKICVGLNRQNRMAKLSSFECQTLFLSLYFKEHVETTQAVVTNLRSNGFWVYVPRFDMRGPVYLSDMNGKIHIDPSLLNLPSDAGADPSTGFAASGKTRLFLSGSCQLLSSPQEVLKVKVPESQATFDVRVLDVVTVKISSDNWDTRSRVPSPKLHLIGGDSSRKAASRKSAQSSMKKQLVRPARDEMQSSPVVRIGSLYQEGLKLETPSYLQNIPIRTRKDHKYLQETKGAATIPGRIIYGDFRNPDTHSAKQEASIAEAAEAAKERRNQAMAAQARNSEYSRSAQIEKDATARMQRLAANKRNARR